MNLKDIWEDMYKKVKEVGKCGLQMDTYGKLKITMLNNCQVHKLNFSLN